MQKSEAKDGPAAGSSKDENRREQTMSDLKAQLEAIREEIRTLGQMTKTAAVDELESLKQRGSEAAMDTRDRIEYAEEYLLDEVRRRPLRALLIAAGVGALVGLVMHR